MRNSATDSPRTFNELLVSGAEKYGDTPALIHRGHGVSYVQLLRMCQRLATSLQAAGITEGDRVAVVLPNGWHFVAAVFAVVMARAIVVPLDFGIRPGSFLRVARDCGVKALILDHSVLSRLQSLFAKDHGILLYIKDAPASLPGLRIYSLEQALSSRHQDGVSAETSRSASVDPTSVVSITYTSGSSGNPKGVMHSHQSWLSGSIFTARYLGVSYGGKMMIPLPLHHAYSFRHVLAYLINGGALVLSEDILDSLKVLKCERPHAFLLVPSACNIILKYYKEVIKECRSFLDIVSIGTAPVSADQLRQLKDLLPNTSIFLPYGLTEGRVGFLDLDDKLSGTRLVAIAEGLNVSLINENDQLVPAGQVGEIVIKGEGVMVGYWGSTEAERRAIQERGVRTGDLAYLNEDGSIILMGRKDDLINVGGRKVDPKEVEDILNQHPAIVESVVVGTDDPLGITDKRVMAMVVVEKGAVVSEEELKAYCKRHLETYKVPIRIEFREFLQKSSVGKVFRKVSEAEP